MFLRTPVMPDMPSPEKRCWGSIASICARSIYLRISLHGKRRCFDQTAKKSWLAASKSRLSGSQDGDTPYIPTKSRRIPTQRQPAPNEARQHSRQTRNSLRALPATDWLHVSADELRFGTLAPAPKTLDPAADLSALTMQDRDMLTKYSRLSVADRKTVCDVVLALALAATLKNR